MLAAYLCVALMIPAAEASRFPHGVAAGDVTDAAAVLWTRADVPGTIEWQISRDPAFATIERSGVTEATLESDLTIHVEIDGLDAATTCHYRFRRTDGPDAYSNAGTFRTAPRPDDAAPVRLVLSGDSNAARRPFDLLRFAAEEDADVFLYVGDTMYSDVPAGELGVATTLDDYRAKYRQNRDDVALRTLMASTTTWALWDDHEVENDYSGPMLRAAGRGAQLDAAYQAFFEYMPVRRSSSPFRVYRSFRWGSTAEVFLLDGRQYRDAPADAACAGAVDPFGLVGGFVTYDAACVEPLLAPRTMLGAEQLAWLEQGLAASPARVKLVVTDVPIEFVGFFPYDRWDGYDAERKALFEFIDAHRIAGVTFLTTDFHTNAYNPDVMAYFRRERRDYSLHNGVTCPEIIVGPIATNTLWQELIDQGTAVLGLDPSAPRSEALITAAARVFVDDIVDRQHLTFVEPDRYAYAVIDVSADGAVRTRFRGLRAGEPAVRPGSPQAGIETLHEEPPPPPAIPCGLPLLPVVAISWLLACRGRIGSASVVKVADAEPSPSRERGVERTPCSRRGLGSPCDDGGLDGVSQRSGAVE